jgi:pyruvate,water dikinase
MNTDLLIDQPVEDWDPLHTASPPDVHWSSSNFGEAMPGVMTPLGWTFFGPSAERAGRGALAAMGVLSRREAAFPAAPGDRMCNVFFGRAAGSVNLLVEVGNRLPGTNGAAIAEQIFGAMPAELSSVDTRRRYPVIAARFPYTFATINARARRACAASTRWWQDNVARIATLDRAAATALFREAHRRFDSDLTVQAIHGLCAVQPIYDQLRKLVEGAGVGEVTAFMSGYGAHAESELVLDMWAASRSRCTIEDVVRRHGYHGPNEGEISGRVWREDATALRELLDGYRHLPDEQDPARGLHAKAAERDQLERDLLARVPAAKRPAARLTLRLAAAIIPVRGVGKSAFLQSLDMARGAARRIGHHLVADGQLDDVEDIFFLTTSEIGDPPSAARELVARRRERHAFYRTLEIPTSWTGQPRARVRTEPAGVPSAGVVLGVGASPGVVEGRVRVVTGPDDAVEPGEVLVAPVTDPSWAAIMFVSQALVVDIGGPISHAAIVARELGIPCVVNTKAGTQLLRTGDVVRVDGTTGQVEILSRA